MNEEAKENLGVLQTGYQKLGRLGAGLLQLGQAVRVYLYLHRQHAYLLGIDLQLVGLAVEVETLDYVRLLTWLCTDECKLYIRVEVTAQVFEG